MKIRLITALAIALILVATMSLPAIADDQVVASVTVNAIISITITDSPPAGINFGSLSAGTANNTDADANVTIPSIIMTLNTGSNVNVDMQIKGTNFISGSNSIAVTNAKYSLTSAGAKTALSTTYTTFKSDVAPGVGQNLWHWLDVPSGVTAGSYSSNFSYKAIVHP